MAADRSMPHMQVCDSEFIIDLIKHLAEKKKRKVTASSMRKYVSYKPEWNLENTAAPFFRF